MPKKILIICFIILFTNFYSNANTYYDNGTKLMNSYQYTSAIEQYKNAIRQYPNDYNSRIGLINAYSKRASHNYKTLKDNQKTLNDLRSALFYVKYYGDGAVTPPLQSAQASLEKNIKELLNIMKPDTSAEGLLASAQQLRKQGELPSSFIVYQQLINTKYDKAATTESGDILNALKNPSLAIVYYNKLLRTEPDNYDVLIKMGECYQQIGNTTLATENFNNALLHSKNSKVALDNLEKIWRQQVYKNPSDAEAHANLGVIFQQKGNYDEALAEYQKAEQLNPNNMTTKLNLGTLYQEQGKYENAITLYDKVLFNDAENINARKYKAQCLEALGKNKEAIVEYKRVAAFDENNVEAKAAIVKLTSATGSPDEFISSIEETYKNPYDKAIALYQAGYDMHKNKKYELAKTYYLKSLTYDKNQPDLYLNLSDIYVQLKDNSSAIKVLNEAKSLFPTNPQITQRLDQFKLADTQKALEDGGKALLKGDYEKALSYYKSVQPQTPESLLGIASTYQTMGKYNDAISYYKSAYNMAPNDIETAYYIASAYSAIDDFNNAKVYVNKVLAKNPNHQNAKTLLKYISEEEVQQGINKALDLYNTQNYQDAYNLLSSMISKNPTVAVPYYYRGMVLDEQKKYEQAILDYKNTIKYDSNFDLAYYSLGVDYDNLKNYKEAFAYYNKYLKITKEQNEYTSFVKNRIEELKKYVPNLTQAQ